MARGRGGSRAGNANANSKRRFGGRGQTRHTTSVSVAASCAASSSSSQHLRPRRGPPAIFVTCEAGREHKCKREALELLHHYYYASRGAKSKNDTEKDTTLSNATSSASKTTTATTTTATVSSSLTLEEELAMLRKGAVAEEVLSYQPNSKRQRIDNDGGDVDDASASAMKSPFAIYDTGMRGMICILCTLPQCEYIPYDEILMQLRNSKEDNSNNNEVMQRSCSNSDAIECHDQDGDEHTPSVSASAAVTAAAIDDNKKQSSKEKSGVAVTQNVDIPPPPILWDPVQTVKCILNDAKRKQMSSDEAEADKKNNNADNGTSIVNIENTAMSGDGTVASPPGSRFISRILPMQATVRSRLLLFCVSILPISHTLF